MNLDYEIGKLGEEYACTYIEKMGMEIIERNFRCKMGEIDIIAIDGEELVFIEVKTRGQLLFGMPSEAVGNVKKKHIYRVAEYYLMLHHLETIFCRIDVIEVFLYEKVYKVNYIKNSVLEKPHSKEREDWKEENEFREFSERD